MTMTEAKQGYNVKEFSLGTVISGASSDFHLDFLPSAILKQILLIAEGTLTNNPFRIEVFEKSAMIPQNRILKADIIEQNTIKENINESYTDLDYTSKLHIRVTNEHLNNLNFSLKIKYL